MSDLRELYQEVILDHNKRPRNFGALPEANSEAEGHNPICGDRFKVMLKLDGNTVEDVSFEGSGCAISTASASLMTDAIKGKTLSEVEELHREFRRVVTADPESQTSSAVSYTHLTLPTNREV